MLAVIDALHLNKPIIVGHSVAGEELSYIGSRHPEKVAGLIYLDAGYPYALYRVNGELELDAIELRNQLRQFINGHAMEPVKDYDSLIANLERVEQEVKAQQQNTGSLPPTPVSPRMTPDLFAIMEGRQRFITIYAPALVIFADEDNPVLGDDPQSRASAMRNALQRSNREQQIAASSGKSLQPMFSTPMRPMFFAKRTLSSPHSLQQTSCGEAGDASGPSFHTVAPRCR